MHARRHGISEQRRLIGVVEGKASALKSPDLVERRTIEIRDALLVYAELQRCLQALQLAVYVVGATVSSRCRTQVSRSAEVHGSFGRLLKNRRRFRVTIRWVRTVLDLK